MLSDLERVQIELLDGGVDREPLGEHELGVDPIHGCQGEECCHRGSQHGRMGRRFPDGGLLIYRK